MLLRSAGRRSLAGQIAEDMRLARLAARLLREDTRFEVDEPVLSIVTFRHRTQNGETEARRSGRDTDLMEAILADGHLMLSTTVLDGRNTLRLVVMNHRTTETEIRKSVQRILFLAR
jgi:glutamate/tyrosine decarboxylase-like PLP-dependent enzyme